MSLSRKNFLSLSGLGLASSVLKGYSHLLDSNLIKPKRIKKGATIGLVAPASPIYSSSQFDEMLIALKDLGYVLKIGEACKR
ncbi:MAG: hypothetical protein BalsKO_12340 [Balneolaceae bacterium]